jgi:hypothetical protein
LGDVEIQTLFDDHVTSTIEIPIPAAPFDLDEADSLIVEEVPEVTFVRC